MRFAVAASIVLLLASDSSLYGDIIVSTYCRVPLPGGDVIEVSSSSGCSVTGEIVEPFKVPSSAEAQANAYYQFESYEPEIPDGTLSAYVEAYADTLYAFPSFQDYSTARASVELSLRATTAGPVRSGLIELKSNGYGRGYGVGGFDANSTIGNLFGLVDGMYCIGDCWGR